MSTLAQTDPELIEYFHNFAFDEVLSHGSLDAGPRLIVQLAALIGGQALGEYRVMLGAALTISITPVQIKEVITQAIPYVGMGKVFDFLHTTNEVLAEAGVELPLPPQSTTTPYPDGEGSGGAGRGGRAGWGGCDDVCELSGDLLHIQRYLSGNCFGDHLTRTGLDLATRELVTFSFLISMGGADPQVKGHVRGNVNVGNDRSRLIEVVTQLLPFIGYPPRPQRPRAPIDAVAPSPGRYGPKGGSSDHANLADHRSQQRLRPPHDQSSCLERGDRVTGTVRNIDSMNDLTRAARRPSLARPLDVTDTAAVRAGREQGVGRARAASTWSSATPATACSAPPRS